MFLPINTNSFHKKSVNIPRWSFHRQSGVPNNLNNWLWDSDSLTAKLVALSKGTFSVKVLRQTFGRPELHESIALNIDLHERCMIREVVLVGAGQAWVFARSLIPVSSLRGRLRQLRVQGNKPLGAFLFSQPNLVRSPIAVASLMPQHNYVPKNLQGGNGLWGRRSVFYVDKKPILVSEVFLNDFINHLNFIQTSAK